MKYDTPESEKKDGTETGEQNTAETSALPANLKTDRETLKYVASALRRILFRVDEYLGTQPRKRRSRGAKPKLTSSDVLQYLESRKVVNVLSMIRELGFKDNGTNLDKANQTLFRNGFSITAPAVWERSPTDAPSA